MSSRPNSKRKIIKTGNSAAVTIPHKFMSALNLRIGDEVLSETDYRKGKLTYSFPAKRQLMFDNQSSFKVKSKRKI